jgi:hypothetical protein
MDSERIVLLTEARRPESILRGLRSGDNELTGTGCAVPASYKFLSERFPTRLFIVFSGFRDVGLVARFGHSLHKRLTTCGGGRFA